MPMFIRTAAAVSSARRASTADDRHGDSRFAVSGFDSTLAFLRQDAPRPRMVTEAGADRAGQRRGGMRAVLGVCLVAAVVAAVQVHAAFQVVEAVRAGDVRCEDSASADKRLGRADGAAPCPIHTPGSHRGWPGT